MPYIWDLQRNEQGWEIKLDASKLYDLTFGFDGATEQTIDIYGALNLGLTGSVNLMVASCNDHAAPHQQPRMKLGDRSELLITSSHKNTPPDPNQPWYLSPSNSAQIDEDGNGVALSWTWLGHYSNVYIRLAALSVFSMDAAGRQGLVVPTLVQDFQGHLSAFSIDTSTENRLNDIAKETGLNYSDIVQAAIGTSQISAITEYAQKMRQ